MEKMVQYNTIRCNTEHDLDKLFSTDENINPLLIKKKEDGKYINNPLRLVFGPGDFPFPRTLEIPINGSVSIVGSGSSTVLRAKDHFNSALITLPVAGSTDEMHRSISDLVLANASTKQNPNRLVGIKATSQAQMTISRVQFLGLGTGIDAEKSNTWQIADCSFSNGTENGIHFNNSKNMLVRSCFFRTSKTGMSIIRGSEDIHLLQCHFLGGGNGNDYGVHQQGGDAVQIVGCHFEGAKKADICCEPDPVFAKKQAEILAGTAPGTTPVSPPPDPNVKRTSISGCWFGDSTPTTGTADDGKPWTAKRGTGIHLIDSRLMNISNNRIGGHGGPAIRLDRVDSSVIQGNRIEMNCRNVDTSKDDEIGEINLTSCANLLVVGNWFEGLEGQSITDPRRAAILFRRVSKKIEVDGTEKTIEKDIKHIHVASNHFNNLGDKTVAQGGHNTVDSEFDDSNFLGGTKRDRP